MGKYHINDRSRDDKALVFCDCLSVTLGELTDAANAASMVADLAPDLAQLLDGWHNDGTAWSEWDESVRKRLSEVQAALECIRRYDDRRKRVFAGH
jgi:hypothetical protein